MKKKTLLASLIAFLLLASATIPIGKGPQPPVDPNTLIIGTISMPHQADPATAYDTASRQLIMNVYEPLIDFDRNTTEPDPRKQGMIDQFVPRLATELPTKEAIILDLDNLTVVEPSIECSKWVNIAAPSRRAEVLDLLNLTVVNQTNPVCTIWEDLPTGNWYHLYYWNDTNPTGELDPSDLIYLRQIDKVSMEPIPCTERAYHVEVKEHIGSTVHMIVTLVGCYYHINSWRVDVVYMEELDPIPHNPAEPIPCTKLAWHVEYRDYVGDQIHLTVKRTWYIFKIRQGVKIHPWKYYNGTLAPAANLTCEDVEYSFERAMVQDGFYSSAWTLYEPTLDAMNGDKGWNLTNIDEIKEWIQLIECAFQQNCTHFWMNVCIDFDEIALFQILAQTWSCIVPKAFAVNHGCWPGESFNASGYPVAIYWRRWPTLTTSPLDRAPTTLAPPGVVPGYVPTPPGWTGSWTGHAEPPPILRGTGPYKFTYLDRVAGEYRVDKFTNYWRGWASAVYPYHVNTVIVKEVYEWATRKQAFLAGDYDIIYVPRAYVFDLLQEVPPGSGNWVPLPGVVCYKDMPTLTEESIGFNTEINPESPYIGTGSFPYGIPPNFFNNSHVLSAFASSFNYSQYTTEAWFGEAFQLQPDSLFNLTRAEEEFKAAYFVQDGTNQSVWDWGFTLTVVYNEGNDMFKIDTEILEYRLETLNPLFTINVVGMPWHEYLLELTSGYFPVHIPGYVLGWPRQIPPPVPPPPPPPPPIPAKKDIDKDKDGVPDYQDSDPNDPKKSRDTDGDGKDDTVDDDIDGDGLKNGKDGGPDLDDDGDDNSNEFEKKMNEKRQEAYNLCDPLIDEALRAQEEMARKHKVKDKYLFDAMNDGGNLGRPGYTIESGEYTGVTFIETKDDGKPGHFWKPKDVDGDRDGDQADIVRTIIREARVSWAHKQRGRSEIELGKDIGGPKGVPDGKLEWDVRENDKDGDYQLDPDTVNGLRGKEATRLRDGNNKAADPVEGMRKLNDDADAFVNKKDRVPKIPGVKPGKSLVLPIVQPLGRCWQRNWIQGWYYNPMYTPDLLADTEDPSVLYFYDIWKGFKEDFNRDMKVNILDLVILAGHFGHTVPPDDPKYDLNGDGKINILDLVKCAVMFGAGVP